MQEPVQATLDYYRRQIEADPLLPRSGESADQKVTRIQDEHEFYAKNNGRQHCWCLVCWPFDLF